MTRDDRDTESANPSKSFKVGEFDRLSGFFTPVWESKRRIRSESPLPSSSRAANSARRGAANAEDASKPAATQASDAATRTKAAPTQPAAGTEPSGAKARALEPARSPSTAGAPSDGKEPVRATGEAGPVPAARRATAEAVPSNAGSERPPLDPEGPTAEPLEAPMRARVQSRAGERPSQPPAPGAATAPLRVAAPNLPAGAYMDREPELRVPPASPAASDISKTSRLPAATRRSLRASAAATRVHEQLRARTFPDSIGMPLTRDDAVSTGAGVAAVGTALPDADPSRSEYPIQLLRRLRRTIHLSTPLPESVRAFIARHARN